MPTEIVMPRLGWDMKVGSVAEWLKGPGERVEAGEVVCLIAGDKATTELEAPASGTLHLVPDAPEVGHEVPVGTLLGYLLAPGEAAPAVPAVAAGGAPGIAAPARSMASELGAGGATGGLAVAGVAGARAGEGGAWGARVGRVVASPRARRAAAALGLDWRTLVGSGRGGRILERDAQRTAQDAALEDAAQRAPGSSDAPTDEAPRPAATEVTESGAARAVPLHGLRQLTAERMAQSARTVAPVTLVTEADATALVRLREQAKAERAPRTVGAVPSDAAAGAALRVGQVASAGASEHQASQAVPSVADLVVKIVALALVDQPELNTSLTEAGVVHHAEVHVAVAIDTPHGLLAPVVHHAHRRSVEDIARERRRLTEAALAGRLRPADLAGATFTVSNLGPFEIDAFTPIVPLPQCAILGLGRIVARPVVVDETTEQVAVRRMLTLSLSFDHRLVDGAPAARFLQRIKHFVERPTRWLFR